MFEPNGSSTTAEISLLCDALEGTIAILSRYLDVHDVSVNGAIRLSRWQSWLDRRTSARLCSYNPQAKRAKDANLTLEEAGAVDQFMGRHLSCAKFFQGNHHSTEPKSTDQVAFQSYFPPLMLGLANALKTFGFDDSAGTIFRADGGPAYNLLLRYGGQWGALQALIVWRP